MSSPHRPLFSTNVYPLLSCTGQHSQTELCNARLDCGVALQAEVEIVTGGSPRVLNPEAAEWYDENVQNYYRIVNNKDIVPSLPAPRVG